VPAILTFVTVVKVYFYHSLLRGETNAGVPDLEQREADSTTSSQLPFINTFSGQAESYMPLEKEDANFSTNKWGYDVKQLLDLSLTFEQSPSYDIKAAVCLKTLHGEGRRNLMMFVLSWIAYNRLLGFDQILIWYTDFKPPGFAMLEALPYVRLIKNIRNPKVKPGDYEIARDNAGGQEGDIAECQRMTRNEFDWVFVADWDEYLWFSEKIRLKEFLNQHRKDRYLSFGKWIYSYKDVVDVDEQPLFGLENVSRLGFLHYALYTVNTIFLTCILINHAAPFHPQSVLRQRKRKKELPRS
jgi:hypothetical protein